MEKRTDLLGVLRTLFKWKRPILIVCTVATAGSIIISLLLPVYYKAYTIFLAASPDQAKPDMLFGRINSEPEYYGDQSDIDRLLTIGESSELVDFLVDSFDLYRHYNIDPAGKRAAYKVREVFFGRYDIVKTKRDAIELSIEDTDPSLAAKMTNAAREKIDEFAQKLIKDSQWKALASYEQNIATKEKQLKAAADSLVKLRETYGIYNIDAQTESLTDQYAQAEARLIRNRALLRASRESGVFPRDTIAVLQARVNSQEEEVGGLKQKIDLLNQGMGIVNLLHEQYTEANRSLGEDLERYKIISSTYHSVIPATILVENAGVPVVKSRLKRSIIVLAAVAVALLFSVIAVLMLDTYKDINWPEIINDK